MDNFLILWYNSRKAAIVHGPYRCTIRRFAPVVQWPKSREKSERTATRPEPAAKTAAPLCFCGTAGSVSPRRFAPMPPALGRKLPKMVFQIHTPKGPFRKSSGCFSCCRCCLAPRHFFSGCGSAAPVLSMTPGFLSPARRRDRHWQSFCLHRQSGCLFSSGAFRERKRPLPLCRRTFLPTLPGFWFSR